MIKQRRHWQFWFVVLFPLYLLASVLYVIGQIGEALMAVLHDRINPRWEPLTPEEVVAKLIADGTLPEGSTPHGIAPEVVV